MVAMDLLNQVRMLRGLSQEELEAVAAVAGVWECQKGQYVFKEGDESDVLYIIQSGGAAAVISTGVLVNHTLTTLTPGEVFGELGFLDRQPRTASIRCTEYSTLLSITREDFRRLGQDNLNIQRVIYKNLGRIIAERLRNANDRLKELAGRDKSIAVSLPQHFMV